jgi:cbb3-type cytochrome oxidase subunit 3
MKVRNYLESIAGVGIFPVIGLLIFFLFFTLFTIWVIKTRKQAFETQSCLPLEAEETHHQQLLS